MVAGTILLRSAPLSYHVQVGNKVWRRHIDQLVSRNSQCITSSTESTPFMQLHLPGQIFTKEDKATGADNFLPNKTALDNNNEMLEPAPKFEHEISLRHSTRTTKSQ